MRIKEKIYKSIDVSRDSGVPVLFLSNPGMSKTTCVYSYAKDNGYEVTELRGSTSTPEDITGYYVNEGKDTLTIKYPEWFIKLIEDDKPHILFLDEITTVVKNTQAALLKLVFDRQMHDKKLPDSTLIISAGNYNGNLQGGFGMLSPMLNRFCIVNLTLSRVDLRHFVISEEEDKKQFSIVNDKVDENLMKENIARMVDDLVNTYSNSVKNEASIINLNNSDYSNVDSAEGMLYGILTPRTVSYLTRMLISCAKLGYTKDMDYIALGLIGFGTGEVTDLELLERTYHSDIKNYVNDVLLITDTESTFKNIISNPSYVNSYNNVKRKQEEILKYLSGENDKELNTGDTEPYFKAISSYIDNFTLLIRNIETLKMTKLTLDEMSQLAKKSKEAKNVYKTLQQLSKDKSFSKLDVLNKREIYMVSILEPIFNATERTKGYLIQDNTKDDYITQKDIDRHIKDLS